MSFAGFDEGARYSFSSGVVGRLGRRCNLPIPSLCLRRLARRKGDRIELRVSSDDFFYLQSGVNRSGGRRVAGVGA